VAARFTADINRLRASLRGKSASSDLTAALRQAIEQLGVAALAADNSTRYIASNAPARALTGYSDAELLRLTVMDLTPIPNSESGRRLWQEFIAGGVQHGEYELKPRRGAVVRVRYWAYASVAPGVHVSLLVPVDSSGTIAH
jgi:PAS domain S-box-containing protein